MFYHKLILLISCLSALFINTNIYAQNDKKTWSVDAAVAPIYTNRSFDGFFSSTYCKKIILYNVGIKKQFNRLKVFAFCGYFNQKYQDYLRYYTDPSEIITITAPPTEPFLGLSYPNSTLLATNNFHFLQLQAGVSYALIKKTKWDLSIKLAYNPTIILAQNYVVSSLQDGTISQRSANNRPDTKNNRLLQLQTGLICNYTLYKNISSFAEVDFATVQYKKNHFQYQLGTNLGLSYHF